MKEDDRHMTSEDTLDDLKQLVLSACNMEDDEKAKELTADEPLFGPDARLGLDSLDAVEIVFLIQKRYGVRIETHAESRQAMATLRTLADYIHASPKSEPGTSSTD